VGIARLSFWSFRTQGAKKLRAINGFWEDPKIRPYVFHKAVAADLKSESFK
jgi:hypothetical protein